MANSRLSQQFVQAILCCTAFILAFLFFTTGNCAAQRYRFTSSGTTQPQYARERKADMLHIAIVVTPDFDKRTIKGETTLTFKPLNKPLDELRLDAVDLSVDSVVSSAQLEGHQSTDKEIVLTFAQPIPVGKETKVTISYSAQPQSGLHFRVPSNGYPAEDMHVFSQGETQEARYWFPCYDYPNEKFTSEITCLVPDGMTVASNGKLVSSTKDSASGLQAVHWLQDKPHSAYLIALIAGKFSTLSDQHRGIPLKFYTPVSDAPQAPLAFKDTKAMMKFFEDEIGVQYPWDQYGQAIVRDFTHGGMENTSLTILHDGMLHTADTENILPQMGPYTSEDLASHELAHQWFGDLVTFRDWSHCWLNEGFATFYQTLFLGHHHGRNDMLLNLMDTRNMIVNAREEWLAIVNREYDHAFEQFDHRSYQKGAWVLHMLREELGADLFRKCVKTYLERHKFQNVVTSDFTSVVEEVTGRSFDRFFDQWLYKPGIPQVKVTYSWDEQTKLAKLSVTQKQKTKPTKSRRDFARWGQSDEGNDDKADDNNSEGGGGGGSGGGGGGGGGAGGGGSGSGAGSGGRGGKDSGVTYQFPLTVKFKVKGETIEKRLDVTNKEEDFSFPLKAAPDAVLVDPDIKLLADIDFKPTTAMLYYQLADKTDTMGRVLAAISLGSKGKNHTAVSKLQTALQTDEYFGVRIKAAQSLRKIHSEEALDALIASTNQPDARVRQSVVENIGEFFHPKARQALLDVLKDEKNPAVTWTAVEGLGIYREPDVREALVKYLNTDSYHDEIARSALKAIRDQADVSWVEPVRQFINTKKDSLTAEALDRALYTLGLVDSDEQNKDEVFEFISKFINSKRETIQTGAIRGLGALGDMNAIPILNTFAADDDDSDIAAEAGWAISSIYRANKPTDNVKQLSKEVLELKTSNNELKKEIDKLKKSVRSIEKGKAKSGTATSATPASSTTAGTSATPATSAPPGSSATPASSTTAGSSAARTEVKSKLLPKKEAR